MWQANKFAPHMTPFRSFCSLSSGASRLFSDPITSYRDGRNVLKGLVQGICAMIRSLSLEALDVSAVMTSAVEKSLKCAERAVDDSRHDEDNRFVALGSGSSTMRSNTSGIERCLSAQPASASEGFVEAGRKLGEGLDFATEKLLSGPVRSFNDQGIGGAVVTAIRNVPAAAVAPVAAATGAIRQTLLGLRNSIEPSRRLDHR